MSNLPRFVLSSPEAVEQFRQIARLALEREGELSPALYQQLEQRARALRVHAIDVEKVLQEVLALPSVQAAQARRKAERGQQIETTRRGWQERAYKQEGEIRFTKSHEWARWEGGTVVCGITDYGQHLLSDIVYVEAPDVGESVAKGYSCGTIESVKAAEDFYAPMSGEIIEVNMDLADNPEWINEDPYPYGKGWIFRLQPSDPAEFNDLMDAATYKAYVAEEEEKGGALKGGFVNVQFTAVCAVLARSSGAVSSDRTVRTGARR